MDALRPHNPPNPPNRIVVRTSPPAVRLATLPNLSLLAEDRTKRSSQTSRRRASSSSIILTVGNAVRIRTPINKLIQIFHVLSVLLIVRCCVECDVRKKSVMETETVRD